MPGSGPSCLCQRFKEIFIKHLFFKRIQPSQLNERNFNECICYMVGSFFSASTCLIHVYQFNTFYVLIKLVERPVMFQLCGNQDAWYA